MAKQTARTRLRFGAPALVLQAVVAVLTLRDIARRSDDRIRGPRRLWQVVATANTGGAVAYWVVGRRRDG